MGQEYSNFQPSVRNLGCSGAFTPVVLLGWALGLH